MKELDKIFIDSISDLRSWLAINHKQEESMWLVRWKKDHTKNYLKYDDIVDELICYGWVDSLPKALDEKRSMIRISPRNPKSNWSAINKARVLRLSESKKIHPSGQKIINAAKENGAWDFLNDVEQLIVPPDLEEAFKVNFKAKEYYERFPDSSKRAILEWIKNAKQDSTRQKRIKETVEKAEVNLKANHPKGRDAGPT